LPVGRQAADIRLNRLERAERRYYLVLMVGQRRFPPPWRIEERAKSFIVTGANGQTLCNLHFEDEAVRPRTMNRLNKDEARRIAIGIVRTIDRNFAMSIHLPALLSHE
jgi:hypothetical protein